MPDPDFISYVKDIDVHDGRVERIWHDESLARVLVRIDNDKLMVIEFRGVIDLKGRTPEQMVLYSLSEMKAKPPFRRFVFANWDETDDSYLELVAQDLTSFSIESEQDFVLL